MQQAGLVYGGLDDGTGLFQEVRADAQVLQGGLLHIGCGGGADIVL